jgi:hypothetical protein
LTAGYYVYFDSIRRKLILETPDMDALLEKINSHDRSFVKDCGGLFYHPEDEDIMPDARYGQAILDLADSARIY